MCIGDDIMNRKEWLESGRKDLGFKGKAFNILKSSLTNFDENEIYHIHHLRDTEEQRQYNDAHYEYWGFEQDGETFVPNKYVTLLTQSDHIHLHGSSDETRNNISCGLKQHYADGHSPWMKGKTHTDEAKEKNRQAHLGNHYSLGYKHTDEARAKISKSIAGKQSHFKGKQHTVEAKEKNRQSHLGLKHSEETKQKMSLSQLGKHSDFHPSEEARKKMSDAHKGKLVSDDTKQKLSTRMQEVKVKYQLYRANGGHLKWQAFQSALKKNEIPLSFFNQNI